MKNILFTTLLIIFSFFSYGQELNFEDGKPVVIELPIQENTFSPKESIRKVKKYFKNSNFKEIKKGISIPLEKSIKVSYPMQIMTFKETIKYDLIVQFKENRHRIILKNFKIHNTLKEKYESLETYYSVTKKKWKKKIRLKLNEAKEDAISLINKSLKSETNKLEENDDW